MSHAVSICIRFCHCCVGQFAIQTCMKAPNKGVHHSNHKKRQKYPSLTCSIPVPYEFHVLNLHSVLHRYHVCFKFFPASKLLVILVKSLREKNCSCMVSAQRPYTETAKSLSIQHTGAHRLHTKYVYPNLPIIAILQPCTIQNRYSHNKAVCMSPKGLCSCEKSFWESISFVPMTGSKCGC